MKNLIFLSLGVELHCALVECGNQPAVKHATSTTKNRGDLHFFNSTIYYSCNEGFETKNETVVRVSFELVYFLLRSFYLQ